MDSRLSRKSFSPRATFSGVGSWPGGTEIFHRMAETPGGSFGGGAPWGGPSAEAAPAYSRAASIQETRAPGLIVVPPIARVSRTADTARSNKPGTRTHQP